MSETLTQEFYNLISKVIYRSENEICKYSVALDIVETMIKLNVHVSEEFIAALVKRDEKFLKNWEKEQWLWKNKNALDSVLDGLKDSAEGRIVKRKEFTIRKSNIKTKKNKS